MVAFPLLTKNGCAVSIRGVSEMKDDDTKLCAKERGAAVLEQDSKENNAVCGSGSVGGVKMKGTGQTRHALSTSLCT